MRGVGGCAAHAAEAARAPAQRRAHGLVWMLLTGLGAPGQLVACLLRLGAAAAGAEGPGGGTGGQSRQMGTEGRRRRR